MGILECRKGGTVSNGVVERLPSVSQVSLSVGGIARARHTVLLDKDALPAHGTEHEKKEVLT